jgi:dihydrofolate reductase
MKEKRNERRIIAAINMTLDGFCDHTVGIVDDELLEHYSNLLNSSDTILYGRITYQLMEYWRTVLNKSTGNKTEDEFAVTIDRISKIVFSNTLKQVDWKTAKLANKGIKEEVLELKGKAGSSILVGSPSLIVSLTKLGLIDEYQLCVHPIISGSGLPLFKDIKDKIRLDYLKSKTFVSGATVLYYESRVNS